MTTRPAENPAPALVGLRQDIVDMLLAGHSDLAITTQLHVGAAKVAATRQALGLPKTKRGKKPAESLKTAFLARCTESGDGHMRWTGSLSSDGIPTLRWRGRHWTARRAAYEIHHGRPSTGQTAPACGQPDCVAPAHTRDLGKAGRPAAYRGPRPAEPVSDEAIAELLCAGHSQSTVARQLRIKVRRVAEIREQLGLPAARPGTKPEPLDATFKRRTIPTEDGHLLWPTSDFHIRTVEGASISARRYAFQQKYGRPPVGKVTAGCGTPRCVHPDHVEDQPMRQVLEAQFASIFGSAA